MKRLLLAALLLSACVPHTPSPRQWDDPMALLATPTTDLAGTWYEVMRYPALFEDGCRNVTTTFRPRTDGAMDVVSLCRRGATTYSISGTAKPAGPGEMHVRLPHVNYIADYVILGRSRDGRTVHIGTTDRTGGWVLHRDRHFTPQERDAARTLFGLNGYDEAALQRTDQR